LLTGQPPFQAATPLDVLLQVREQEPRPPRSRNPRVDHGLDLICLKCLEKDPRRRYASAQALADDLRHWLAGQPLLARPRPWSRRVGRALRRPAARIAAAVLLTAATVLLVVLAVAWLRRPVPEPSPLPAILSALAAGRPVTLIGESGLPAYSKWRCGGATGHADQTEEDFFQIHHLEYGLLELVPDHPMERYRFRAEVRHDFSNLTGNHGPPVERLAGIYFAHSERPTASGPAHCYAAVAFNDIVDTRSKADKQKAIRGNPVGLYLHQHPPKGLQGDFSFVSESKDPFPKYPFPFPQPGQKPWRQLAVEVTPERVRVVCDEQCISDVPHDVWLKQAAELKRIAPAVLVEQPTFAPRNGLGLYVSQGAASYRSVVIEPLP
jgi:eukaryotic-like serine/threonine-protein kinase